MCRRSGNFDLAFYLLLEILIYDFRKIYSRLQSIIIESDLIRKIEKKWLPLQTIRPPPSELSVKNSITQTNSKTWFPPIRLTYSHVYSYENKHVIGGKASNNLKKN